MSDESSPARYRFGVVVTTLGRVTLLAKLLDSLDGQLTTEDQLVIVAQRNELEVRELVSKYPALPIMVTTSERGAARGRNVGVTALPDGPWLLVFPNDSTWFPPGVIDGLRLAASPERFRLGAMTVIDDLGPKLKHLEPGAPLTPVDAWRVIEMGLVISRECFDQLGGFDAAIGTGATTPWQSGESTDLVLRALERWPNLSSSFVWLPRTIWVGGVAETFGLSTAARRWKLRAYGRGAAKVARDHHFPYVWRLRLLVGGATIGLRNPQYRPLDGAWAFVGRLEGFIGRTLGPTDRHAVDR